MVFSCNLLRLPISIGFDNMRQFTLFRHVDSTGYFRRAGHLWAGFRLKADSKILNSIQTRFRSNQPRQGEKASGVMSRCLFRLDFEKRYFSSTLLVLTPDFDLRSTVRNGILVLARAFTVRGGQNVPCRKMTVRKISENETPFSTETVERHSKQPNFSRFL